MVLAVPPHAPSTLKATKANPGIVALSWKDNSLNETGFTIQRATSSTGPWVTVATVPAAASTGSTVTYNDPSGTGTFYYQVTANNRVGYTRAYAAPAAGYPNVSADSVPSNVAGPVSP